MEEIKEVHFYTDIKGKCYISEWIDRLNYTTQIRILDRITRLKYGAYGDYKNVGDKIYELRFFFGSGYRIYFIEENKKIILLLNGGDKISQTKDIKKAKLLFKDYVKKEETK
jgi:putative addiction module killer protein